MVIVPQRHRRMDRQLVVAQLRSAQHLAVKNKKDLQSQFFLLFRQFAELQ